MSHMISNHILTGKDCPCKSFFSIMIVSWRVGSTIVEKLQREEKRDRLFEGNRAVTLCLENMLFVWRTIHRVAIDCGPDKGIMLII